MRQVIQKPSHARTAGVRRVLICVWASAIVVVTGCGGDVAATDVSTATVGAPSLTVQSEIAVGAAPAAVSVGARFVWVANNVGSTVDRIDRATRRVTGSTPVAAGPRALAVADGIVWVASASGSVTRLDAASGAVRGRPIPVADAAGVALGEGSAWVTSRSTDTVVRIDAATGRRDGAAIRVGSAPTDIAVAQGQVWVANSEDGTVTPIDMGTARAGSPIRVAEQQVLALAAGPSGVWVAKSDRPEADPIEVARIDPRSGRLDGPAVRVPGASPMRLAVGDGTVWVADVGRLPALGAGRDPALIRVDSREHARAGEPIRLEGRPSALAIGGGRVWIALADQNAVTSVLAR